MAPPRNILYRGETFRLQTSGRYYQSGRKDASERLLHRRVWIDAHGPIPLGDEIHHRDHDWTNNAIDNLELRFSGEHQRAHMLAKMADPDFYAQSVAALRLGSRAAAAWHASSEGLAWHRNHGKLTWAHRAKVDAICSVCQATFSTHFPTRARFCSRSCRQRESYQRHKTSERQCARCGRPFVCNKYQETRYCGYKCSNMPDPRPAQASPE